MKTIRILLVMFILFVTSLACNLPTSKSNSLPKSSLPIDPQQALNEAVKVDPLSQSITITVTEAQVNTIMLSQIQKIELPSGTNLKDPSVTLQNGLVTFKSKIENGLLTFDAVLSLKPVVSSDKKLTFEVAQADFGPISLPQEVTQQIIEQINNKVNEEVSGAGGTVVIDKVTIENGTMVITAHR